MQTPVVKRATATHGNAAVTFTNPKTGTVDGDIIELTSISWSYSGAALPSNAAPGVIQVESPSGTVIWDQDIVAPGNGHVNFPNGLPSARNADMIVTLTDGGASVVGKVIAIQRRC